LSLYPAGVVVLSRILANSILATLAAALVGCGLLDTPEKARQRLAEATQSGQYRAAAVIARELLADSPSDAELRLQLAELLLAASDFPGAFSEATKAGELGLPLERVGPVLAQAQVGRREFKAALELASRKELMDKQPAAMARVRGIAFLGLKDPSDARRELTTAVALEPKHLPTRIALAAAIEQHESSTAAALSLQEAVAALPESLELQLALGDMQMRAQDAVAARATFDDVAQKALAAKKTVLAAEALQLSGEAALLKLDVETANAKLAELKRLDAQGEPTLILTARLAMIANNPKASESALNDLLKLHPGSIDGRILMAAVQNQLGNYSLAEKFAADVLTATPDDVRARRLMAEVLLSENKPREALAFVQDPTGQADGSLLALGARASALLGELPAATKYLEASIAADPTNDTRPLDLGATLLAAGRTTEAIKVLREATVTGRAIDRQKLLLIEALARDGRRAEATAEAAQLAKDRPTDPDALLVAARGYLLTGQSNDARELLNQVRALNPTSSLPWAWLGQIEWSMGRSGEARKAFEESLARDAKSVSALTGLAQIATSTGEDEQAVQYLERARQASRTAVEPRIGLARFFIAGARFSEAATVLAEARAAEPNSLQVRLHEASLSLARGDAAAAVTQFKQLAADLPQIGALQEDLSAAYLLAREFEAAERAANEAQRLDPKSWRAVYARAQALLAQSRVADARAAAPQLAQLNAPDHVQRTFQGDIAAAAGDYVNAAQAFAAASAAQPSGRLAAKEFRARSLAKQTTPETPLKAWLARNPKDTDIQAMLGQHYESVGDIAGAEKAYEAALASDTNNKVALNNLGWFRLQQRRFDEAVQLARKAHALDAANPLIADTLGWALVQSGKPGEALSVLGRAVASAPENPTIRYHLAVAFAQSGSTNEALRHLEMLEKVKTDWGDAVAARQLLAELRGGRRS
jgi:cellulose synthase operon protein C